MPLSEPMPYRSARALRQLAMVLMVLMGFAFAQTTGNREGKTNFSPASSVEYGSVNLPNLNIEWQLSIRQKLGYFSASLFRENSKWVLWGGNQTRLLTKIEANGGGFLPDFELISPLGIARYENLGVLCGLNKKYGAFEFQEPDGTLHNFSGTICQGVTGTLHDHFGWSIDYPSLTVTSPSGTVFTPSSVTDTNGNAVTKSGAEYIDFSSSNNHPLSVGATYLYYDANGTAQNITPHYGSFILQAKHGCSNVSDSPTASGQLLTQLDYPDGTNVQITYEPTVGAPANVTGRIKTLKLRTGALITYTYNGAHNGFSCEDLGTSGFTRATPDGMWTYVRSLVSGQWVTTVTAPGGQTYTSKFTGTAPYYRVSYDAKESNGSLVQHSYDCYNGNTTGCETVTDLGTSLLTSHFVYTRFGTDTTQTFRTETYFGANQLPTSIRQFDFDGTTRLTATNITYGTYSASGCSPIAGILDHPCTVLVADANNLTMKVDYNTYDANGNLTMNQKLIGNGTYYRTVNTFNPNGTLQKTHLQTGGVVAPDTIYTYGECNGFGFTSVTAGGLTTGQHNDCNGGVPLSVTDANGQSTTFAYNDPLWRKTSSTDPAGNVRNFIYTANSVESKMVYNGGSSVDDVVTTFDTLGRTKLVQKKLGPSSTNYRTVQTNYNSNGQVSSVTRPCSVALGAPCTTYLTTFSYDAIGRTTNVLDQTRPTAGSVSTTYNGRDVLSTLSPAPAGESTKQKRLEFDAIGRLLSVCEITALPGNGTCGQYISSLHGYMTIYAYATNSTDNVVTVRDLRPARSTTTRSGA